MHKFRSIFSSEIKKLHLSINYSDSYFGAEEGGSMRPLHPLILGIDAFSFKIFNTVFLLSEMTDSDFDFPVDTVANWFTRTTGHKLPDVYSSGKSLVTLFRHLKYGALQQIGHSLNELVAKSMKQESEIKSEGSSGSSGSQSLTLTQQLMKMQRQQKQKRLTPLPAFDVLFTALGLNAYHCPICHESKAKFNAYSAHLKKMHDFFGRAGLGEVIEFEGRNLSADCSLGQQLVPLVEKRQMNKKRELKVWEKAGFLKVLVQPSHVPSPAKQEESPQLVDQDKLSEDAQTSQSGIKVESQQGKEHGSSSCELPCFGKRNPSKGSRDSTIFELSRVSGLRERTSTANFGLKISSIPFASTSRKMRLLPSSLARESIIEESSYMGDCLYESEPGRESATISAPSRLEAYLAQRRRSHCPLIRSRSQADRMSPRPNLARFRSMLDEEYPEAALAQRMKEEPTESTLAPDNSSAPQESSSRLPYERIPSSSYFTPLTSRVSRVEIADSLPESSVQPEPVLREEIVSSSCFIQQPISNDQSCSSITSQNTICSRPPYAKACMFVDLESSICGHVCFSKEELVQHYKEVHLANGSE